MKNKMNKSVVYIVLFTFGLSLYSFDPESIIDKEEKEFKRSIKTFILTKDAPGEKNAEVHKKTAGEYDYTTKTYYDKSIILDTYNAYHEIGFSTGSATVREDIKFIDYSILDKSDIGKLEELLTEKIKRGKFEGLILFGSTSKIKLDDKRALTVKFSYKSGLDKAIKNYINNKQWQALQDLVIQNTPIVRLKNIRGYNVHGSYIEYNYQVMGIERMLEHIVHKLKRNKTL